jgi:hypothetical protein
MTTLTIELPDNETDVIATISNIIKNVGGHIDIDNGDLAPAEFEMLKESYKEALLIKAGKKKATPASELWND